MRTSSAAARHSFWRRAISAVASLAVLASLAIAGTASPASAAPIGVCTDAGITVTPLHRPTQSPLRPFYADFSKSSTNHSGFAGYEMTGVPGALDDNLWVGLSSFSGGSLGLAANQPAAVPVRDTSSGGNPISYLYLTASSATATPQTFTVTLFDGNPSLGGTPLCTYSDGFSLVRDIIAASANKVTGISVSPAGPAIGTEFTIIATGNSGTRGAGIAADQGPGGEGVFALAPAMDDNWPADKFMLTGLDLAIDGGSTYHDSLRVYPPGSAAVKYTATYHMIARGTTATPTNVAPVQTIASGTQVKYTGQYDKATVIPAVTSSIAMGKSATAITGTSPGPWTVSYETVVTNIAASAVVLDQIVDNPTPDTFTYVPDSAKIDGTDVVATTDGAVLVVAGPIIVPALGSVTLTYDMVIAGSTENTIVGVIGSTEVGASGANTLIVDPEAVNIVTPSLPSGVVGGPYASTLEALGGTGPYTWSITSGTLPDGLLLDPATGAISGIPAEPGDYTITVTVLDDNGSTDTRDYTITVTAPVQITTPSVANGTVGVPYDQPLTASGGEGPYTWDITAGTLPPGLTIDPATGTISGTPTMVGSYNITVRVIDANGQSDTEMYTIDIADGVVITTTSLNGGTVDQPYTATLEATGGTGPYTWAVTTGTLPDGLSIDPATGIISGTPTTAGSTTITVTVTDDNGLTATHDYTIVINAAVEITTPSLPGGYVGDTYTATLEATGGEGPYTWEITTGTLPDGLLLDPATGEITGTPTLAGDYAITVTVTDANGLTATHDYTITVLDPVVITTPSTPNGTAGAAYCVTLVAEGGDGGPYTWAVTDGTLPPGLTLDPATGKICGTPTTAGSYPFEVTATDGDGRTASKSYTIDIAAAPPAPAPGPSNDPTPNPTPNPTPTPPAPPVDTNVATPAGTPITVFPNLDGPSGDYDWNTMRLVDPVTGALVTSVTTPEGTWVVNPSTGAVTFTPAKGFVGTATVQFRVTGKTGTLYQAPIRVTVLPGKPVLKKTTATVYFDVRSARLDARDKKVLNGLIRTVGKGTIARGIIIGWVQPEPFRKNDLSLSKARAQAVKNYLQAHGLNQIKVAAKAMGRASQKDWKARRATATVWYYPAR